MENINVRERPHGVIVKAIDCEIIVSKFELQSCYYVHFRKQYPWEMYEPPYSSGYGLNRTTIVLLEGWLWHQITYKGWYAIKQRQKPINVKLTSALDNPKRLKYRKTRQQIPSTYLIISDSVIHCLVDVTRLLWSNIKNEQCWIVILYLAMI